MCGRYASSGSVTEIVEEFEVDEVTDGVEAAVGRPRFNIAPTDPVAAVVDRADKESGDVTRKLVALRWGLVPSWSKELPKTAPMINARSETVAEKPAFRKAFASRRCLLPADGYYEWYTSEATKAGKPVKQPFFIRPEDGSPFVMAGLYEFWRNPADDAWVTSCAIITTTATDRLGHIHDRMPMTVADRDAWLDPALTDADAVLTLLRAPGEEMVAYAVSRLVSNVRNDGPELIAPLAAER